MIQIKRNNKVFFTLEDFGEGSKLSYQLMDHHYIILKFTTATPIYFEIGDSVEIPDFGYFELTSSYFPKHNDSDGYDYEMQMDAYYMSWKNKICKYRPQHGANETSFKLTTTVGVHMNVILGNLKALGLTYNGKDFSVDYTTYNNKAFDVQKRFLIEYGSISILDALNSICSEDALNCEWWIDGSIIYLGYCEMEGQTTFEQDVNVLSMSYSESKSTYITRLYAFGSDRNIPKGYFTGADADVTTDGVATDYLMLPNKEVDSDGFYAKDGYIENVNVVKNDKQAIEGVVMFEDEYPKVESAVSSIKTYDSTVDNEDGTKTTQTFWQVTSTDSFTNSFKESWIKSNLTLGIKFTSGALMGMVFDVSFKVIDKVNYFEIVANDTYGRTLPDGVMCPKVGDKYFLFNWDATKITDTDLIPAAQLSLFDRAKQYYLKTMISNANFTCTMDGDKFYNNGTYDYHPLGEQVKLINDMFAQVDAKGKHYRNSRIIGMEIPLDIPYDHPQYIVGEKAATSRLGKLEDKVDSITVNGIQISGGNGGGGVYVIGMNDSTPPTDSNVLSARKTTLSFLSKLHNDTAQGLITFAKGLIVKGLADLMMGAKFGNNAKITELGDAVFNTIKSLDYDNAAEQGFSVEKEKNGKYHAFITNLTIWGKAIFNQLEVRKLSYAGGNVYLSGAGSKIVKVVPVIWESESSEWIETVDKCEGWLCYLLADDGTTATQNLWREGDQVRCKTIGTLSTGTTNASNKSYWRTIPEYGVSSVNEKIYDGYGNELYGGQMFSWIVIGKHSLSLDSMTEEFATAEIGGIPEAGDTIVLDGSRSDTTRQGVLILESTGDNTPRIVGFKGVDRYTHEGKEVFVLSPDRIRLNSGIFEWVSSTGDAMHMVNYRGEWKEGSYAYYDQVNHNNALWTCINENGTRQEPSDASSDWQKVLSGEKGDKGEKGEKGDRGDEGPQGPKGETGAQGEAGAQGPQGEKGEDGAKGTDGEDAISILVEDAPLVFDTDDSGIVPVSISKAAKVKIMKGNLNTSNECSNINSSDDLCVNCKCGATQKDGYIEVSVSGSNIAKNDVVIDGINQGQISATSGYAVAQFVYTGVLYFAQVPFSVNVSKYMGSVKVTAKQYQSQFKALENDLKGSNPTVLKAYTSTIKQAAREISLSVSEKSIGRRNLLVGSAFLREDNNCTISKDARIEINSGYQGTNCIHVIDATEAGNPHYVGAYWDGSQGGRSIKIEKGKKYTMSCFYKTNDINGEFWLEAIYTDKQENATRKGQAKYLSPNGHTVKKVNEWELFTTVVDTTDAEYDYIAFNFWEACNVIAEQINAWICRPMVEEGDTYNGWTLSQNDYDYVGGNLLEDTMTLTKSSDKSNLQFASGLIMFSKYEGCYGILYNKNNSAESQFTEALQYKFPTRATLSGQARIVKNQDYVFSFVAKGSGNINVYLYGDSVHANVFTETCEGNVYPVGWGDGYTQLALTSTYKRYWVHWRINDYTGEGAEVIPDKVLIRVPGDTEAWVTKPKLEEGAQLTDYTERKTDLIDRATAKAAGLEITSSGITLYGEKIKVENTLSTGQTTTAALFTDGAINAALILAQMLTSQGLNGQMVRIADGLINIYGKAGTANIRFGLNSSGQAVLSYYDDNGNFLYDLGPAGVASLSKTDAKITSAQYIKAEDAGLTTPLGENVDLPWIDTTKSWYTATKDNNYILFVKGATGKTTTLYRYSAPRVNGKIVADSANGLGTYDLASAADGRTFTSRTMVKNGALTNLADGVFLTGDATVYDNTKLIPAIKKGQFVTRPSFYVQTASFNAKFTTLGLFGRIYSIQTETTFGNLDLGIMSNNNY